MSLRLLQPDAPTPAGPERPAQSFRFRRHKHRGRWGVDVYLQTPDGSGSCVTYYDKAPHLPDRAAARAWARGYAERNGIPYAEWTPPPEPTPAEQRAAKVRSALGMLKHCDEEAERAEEAEDFPKAVDRWMRGADYCADLIALWPGQEAHLGRCAASRIEMAIRCARRQRARMLAVRNGSALKVAAPMESRP